MSEHRLTETDMRMALRQRGHTEAQISQLLGDIKADAWDEVADNLGEYAEVDDSLIHLADSIRDGNPYRKQEEV